MFKRNKKHYRNKPKNRNKNNKKNKNDNTNKNCEAVAMPTNDQEANVPTRNESTFGDFFIMSNFLYTFQTLYIADIEMPVLSYREKDYLRDLKIQLSRQMFKSEWPQYKGMQRILENICRVESVLPHKRNRPGNRSERLATFYKWAKENGLNYQGLEIEQFPEYDLGLMATQDIQKDDFLFSIPRKLILSEENLKCEKICELFNLSNLRLVFALMIEFLNPDSFWKPYIDLLPDSYNTVLYYTAEEMAELEGSSALAPALQQCARVAMLYVQITYLDFPIDNFKEYFNYELFRWAISTVMTRENLIPRSELKEGQQEPERIAALIPFWDMANHRQGTITSYFNVETQEMESRAQDDFKKGDQVFIYYGDRPNADLMIHNGFINPENPKDSVAIKLGLCASDALYEKRLELLQLLQIPKNGELKVLPPPVHISPELLAFVRVFNMNEAQLDHWIKSERAIDLLHIDCALETELDSKTWQYLQTRLMLLLRGFPTTLEEDEAQLEKVKSRKIAKNYIKNMLLEYRILEKRILSSALDYAKQRTKV